jgi:hypothetical protein
MPQNRRIQGSSTLFDLQIREKLMQRIITVLFVLLASSLLVQARFQSSVAGTRAAAQSIAQGIEGNWEGTIVIGPQKLRLVLKVSQSAEGALQASMDSLDQPGAMGLKVDSITFKDGGNGRHFCATRKQLLSHPQEGWCNAVDCAGETGKCRIQTLQQGDAHERCSLWQV